MNELALFAGAGGGILASRLLGWCTICAVELDPYCREILLRRQEEGHLETFPIWDDVGTFDGWPWRGRVDVISLGPPCQGWSVAGKQLGVDDKRNLWPEAYRIVQEVSPGHILLENVPGIRRYLPVVIRDLRRAGYAVERPLTVAAAALGAGHIRRRVWVRANDQGEQVGLPRQPRQGSYGVPADDNEVRKLQPEGGLCDERGRNRDESAQGLLADDLRDGIRKQPGRRGRASRSEATVLARTPWWESEPGLARLVRRPPYRVDRVRATGNIQVPAVARAAWELLKGKEE